MTEDSGQHAPVAPRPIASRLNAPMTRRRMLGIIGAAATAAVLYRGRDDAASADPPAWQPPPAYDHLVGLV